ncbi:MAG: FHA domain-containing protein, partial [Terriglobales bacterium]
RTFMPDGKTYLRSDDQIWLGPPPRYGAVYDLKRGQFLSVTTNETKRPAEVSLAGKLVDITSSGMMIGRNHKSTVDMRHRFASGVSRDHAVLRRDSEGRIWIEDISARGTWVNGKRIAKGLLYQLGPEDIVHLGAPDGPPVAMHRMAYELIDFALSGCS